MLSSSPARGIIRPSKDNGSSRARAAKKPFNARRQKHNQHPMRGKKENSVPMSLIEIICRGFPFKADSKIVANIGSFLSGLLKFSMNATGLIMVYLIPEARRYSSMASYDGVSAIIGKKGGYGVELTLDSKWAMPVDRSAPSTEVNTRCGKFTSLAASMNSLPSVSSCAAPPEPSGVEMRNAAETPSRALMIELLS